MSKRRHIDSAARLQALAAIPRVRPNEGSEVPAAVGQAVNVNGVMVQGASVNLGNAPVPERKYAANVCGVVFDSGTVQLLFGSKRIGSDELRSLLVIQMSPSGAARLLAAIDQLQPITFDEMARVNGVQAERSKPITSEPAQTVQLAAAFCLFAASVDEATIDFYQASAFAMSAMLHSTKLAVDPVVRVDLRTSLLFGMVEQLRELGSKIPHQSSAETNHVRL